MSTSTLIQKASSVVNAVTRHNDIAMVALLVIVITLMIMPLPTALVDTFIGANLTISFLMLMMAMYVKSPLEFSAFPTMLLFTTLFRVGLNITTTRLILLQADAGEIIFTFGEFATGSNFVVGAVVFLILTVVQFLVIAKGARARRRSRRALHARRHARQANGRSTPTFARASSTWPKPSAAATTCRWKARCTAPWTAP